GWSSPALGNRRRRDPNREQSGPRQFRARNDSAEWEPPPRAARQSVAARFLAFTAELGPESLVIAQIPLRLFALLRLAKRIAFVLVLLQQRKELAIGISAGQLVDVAVADMLL